MPEFLYVLVIFAMGFIELLSLCMGARAILSWFLEDNGGGLMRFLYVITEPAIMPLRKLFHKLNWFQEIPIDMAFLFTFIALMLLQSVLMSFL